MIRSKLSNPKQKRLRKCKVCRVNPVANQMASVCGFECSLKKVEMDNLKKAAKREQEERAAHRVRKIAAKRHGEWEEDLQRLVNKFVKIRDVDDPCISCGTWTTVRWEAGHYISRGANNTLRFELDNIHKQCHRCNVQLSSNAVMYRIGLVKKIGIERVERLESFHKAKKISIPELQEEIARYKGLIKLADKEVA
nr:recombination protein NinG [Janthinobacterium sp. Marseille]